MIPIRFTWKDANVSARLPAVTLTGFELPSGLSECRSYQVLHLFFAVAILPSGKFVEVWLRQF